MNDALAAILRRRSAVEAEMEHLRQRIAFLEKEIPDLDAAERVLRRLSAEEKIDERTEDNDTGKPEGTPAVSEMILTILWDVHRNGREGLTPQGMLELIRLHWWPNASTDSVGPIAWRMWKQNKLGKDGAVYFRLDRDIIWHERNEAPADRHPQGASNLSGEKGTSPETAQSAPRTDIFE